MNYANYSLKNLEAQLDHVCELMELNPGRPENARRVPGRRILLPAENAGHAVRRNQKTDKELNTTT